MHIFMGVLAPHDRGFSLGSSCAFHHLCVRIMPAQSGIVPVQGLLRWEHLPAQSDKEPEQDAQGAQGRVDAAGSGGALKTLALVKKKNYTSKAHRKEQKLVF